MSLRRGGLAAGLALAALASSLALAARTASARPAEVWTRLELVENSAEGPAYDRCAVEASRILILFSIPIRDSPGSSSWNAPIPNRCGQSTSLLNG